MIWLNSFLVLATVTKLCLLRVLPVIVVSLNYIYVMVTAGIFTYHNRFSSFYPRDAMLARVLATALSVCLCLSQVGVLSKRLNESSWFLARELPSNYPTPCCKESSKIRVLPSGTLLQSLYLENFCHGISIIEACYQISWERWTLRAW